MGTLHGEDKKTGDNQWKRRNPEMIVEQSSNASLSRTDSTQKSALEAMFMLQEVMGPTGALSDTMATTILDRGDWWKLCLAPARDHGTSNCPFCKITTQFVATMVANVRQFPNRR